MRGIQIIALWACMLGSAHMTSAQTIYEQPTDLPALHINTDGGQDITSKDTYVLSTIVYVDGDSTAIYEDTKIRGRGNSTWENSDKKPYRLKFAESQKFLGKGYAKSKSWTLLANAGDKSMIRNALTRELGLFVGLPFCPAARFVDLYLNGNYRGTYQISDHVNVDNKRVEVNDTTGFMLEFSQAEDKSEEPHFKGQYGWVDIKSPDVDLLTTEQQSFIEQYFSDTRKRLQNSSFTTYADPRKGYRAKVDTATLVNWYVASEITGNWDALYSVRTYMEHDSTLCFGPLWDEDLGWNNNSEVDMTQELIAEKTQIPGYSNLRPLSALTRKLWQDPWFANAVTTRLNELINNGLEEYLLKSVDSLSAIVSQSQAKNYQLWPINSSGLANFDRYHSYNSYSQYISQLKSFISDRVAFLKSAFASRNSNNRYLDENIALNLKAESGVNVVLRRTAKAGEWSTICLPFALSQSEVARMFGEGTTIARFTSSNNNIVKFSSEGVNSIAAGVPYIIKPAMDVEVPFSFNSTSLTANAGSDSYGSYRFQGTFAPQEVTGGQWVMENGKWAEANDNDALQLKGFRAYITSDTSSRPLLAIDSWLPGDANLDGRIDIADVTAVENYLMGKTPTTFSIENADVNTNGTLDQADVKTIVNIILGIAAEPDQSGTSEGKDYVDLGLPSGTLWATCNVGANSPEEYGNHFAWGETEGDGNGKTQYSWSTYKWCNGSIKTQTKYCVGGSYGTVDNKQELDLGDDAAYMLWGTTWCMPSKQQFEELIDSKYTTTEWTIQNDVKGYKITSKKNGNSIFLPAAGYRSGNSLSNVGAEGYYWTRMLYTDMSCYAYDTFFNSGTISSEDFFYRYGGQSIRPVRRFE